MRTWKRWSFAAIFLLIGGVFYVNALDLIVLKDGNMIEAKIVEISPSEIRYKRINNLDGPTVIVPAANVLSIRYENGTYEIINAGAAPQKENTQKKFIFGINANAGGLLGNALGGGSGAGINIELGKGKFNSEINLMFLTGGFGALVTFNGYWPGQIGGFYLGGGIGYSFFDTFNKYNDIAISFPVGLNIGYKFITKSGLYFRTGAFAGLDIFGLWDEYVSPVYFKPDLAIGWTMR